LTGSAAAGIILCVARPSVRMELLVCVVNREKHLDRILAGFVDIGIRGATVLNSEGMASHLGDGVPVLANLQALLERSRPHNATVFSVIDDTDKVAAAVELISETCGGIDSPATGFVFTIPVSRVFGLATPPASR